MREYTNQHVVANEVRQLREDFAGTILILEGLADPFFFRTRKVDDAVCMLIDAHGKEHALGAVEILNAEGFGGVLAVVDADFDRITGDTHPGPNVLYADKHDIQMMVFCSPVFGRTMGTYGSPEKSAHLVKRRGLPLDRILLEEAEKMAWVLWTSLRRQWSLRFKDMDLGKFVDLKTLHVDRSEFVRCLRARNQFSALTEEEIEDAVDDEVFPVEDMFEFCRGHDVFALAAHALKSACGNIRNCTELDFMKHMFNGFDDAYFRRTDLYSSIRQWEATHPPFRVLP